MDSLILFPLAIAATTASAAEVAQPTEVLPSAEMDEDGDILVIATRIRGQVETDVPPVMTLDEEDIASYGAASIGELIESVSPQTSSGRGRGGGHPVILLNGQRISSFRMMRSIPPEAIRRMEVLPEEVAMRFGYSPNQRLINFILKDNFASKTVAGEYNVPTRGGYDNWELEGGVLSIDGPRRTNVEAKIVETSMLTEAERGISQPGVAIPGGELDPEEFRSLIDESREITLNGSWSAGLGADGLGGSLSIDGGYTRSESRSLFGLDAVSLGLIDPVAKALERDSATDTFEAGFALNKPLGRWQLSATGTTSYSESLTRTDQEGPGEDRARTKDLSTSSLLTLSGQPFHMPAGDVALTLDAGLYYDRTRSADTRTSGPTRLNRTTLSAGANVVLPITSTRDGVWDALGDISLNLGGGIDDHSDFGTLYDWNAGLTWSPTSKLTLLASYIVNEAAPTLNQLGNPEIVTLNVPVYDFVLGRQALVSIVTGGNPALVQEKQRDIKLSANWELPVLRRSSLIVEYFRNRSTDVTQSFPLLTPAVEAAFPDRVVRDASSTLLSIDRRPVKFDEVESSRLRWGLNLTGQLKSGEQAGPEGGRARSSSRGGPPGSGGFGRHGGGGRWNLALYHTYRFTDRVTIAGGIRTLNQLDGDALVAGGVPRHEVEMEGGVFSKGLGVRLNGNWSAPAKVLASGAPGSSDLRFGSIFRLDARIFINLGQREKIVERMPFLKGLRIAFDFDNIFDSRQKVTDENGLIPQSFQRAYRDPQGRVVGIDIRKRF